MNLKCRKKIYIFWALWKPLQITTHLLGQQGELGQQQDSFKEWEQTSKDLTAAKPQDFAVPIFWRGLNSGIFAELWKESAEGELPILQHLRSHSLRIAQGVPAPQHFHQGVIFT